MRDWPRSRRPLGLLLASLTLPACGGDEGGVRGAGGPEVEPDGTALVFDLDVEPAGDGRFFDWPYPSDLRLDPDGRPRVDAFPNPSAIGIVDGLVRGAADARGFPVIPVAHLRFRGPLAPRTEGEVVEADVAAELLLVDVDPDSVERGRLFPVVSETPEPDAYTPDGLLSVAPLPGFVLRPLTTYAFVVRTSLRDASGAPTVQSLRVKRLLAGQPREGEQAAAATYRPLAQTLADLGVDPASVSAATVFTTGDVVAEQLELSEAVRARHAVTLESLGEHPDPEVTELCILQATVRFPQFQRGIPPFSADGGFERDASGELVVQRTEAAPVKLTLPKTLMPASGYPLVLNIHGSGGYSIAMVRPVGDDGPGAPLGPALPYGHRGIAMAGAAMPLNPERLPGARETEYINANNLVVLRDTFRQGQFELRLLLDALLSLEIDPAALGACTGPALPAGASRFRFDPARVMVTGQSMGGMYANMIAAVDPRLGAAVPTGAGGHWTHFIFRTPLQNFGGLLKLVLATQANLTMLHPVLGIGAAALEPADPIAYVPRIARSPLPGHPARPVFEPVAPEDSYFSIETYDAVATAYGNQQAGPELWPSLQRALARAGHGGIAPLPVAGNRTSESGAPYTGVVVAFEPRALPGDLVADGHAIYSRRDDTKHAYACFAESFFRTGVARLPALTQDWRAACE